jgi:hypothetical protein
MDPIALASVVGSISKKIAIAERFQLALLRALRTTIQAAAPFPGVVSLLDNLAAFLPEDPTTQPASSN